MNSYIDYINKSIVNNWDFPAFSDYDGGTYNYKDVAEQIIKFHHVFAKNDIQIGDKIALIGKNTSNWAMTFMIVTSYKAVIVPILAEFKAKDIHHIIDHSDAKILFVDEGSWSTVDIGEMKNLEAVFSSEDFTCLYEKEKLNFKKELEAKETEIKADRDKAIKKENLKLETENPNDLAILSYTSGTTGFSKGVMLPYRSLVANIEFAHVNMPLLPLFHLLPFLVGQNQF